MEEEDNFDSYGVYMINDGRSFKLRNLAISIVNGRLVPNISIEIYNRILETNGDIYPNPIADHLYIQRGLFATVIDTLDMIKRISTTLETDINRAQLLVWLGKIQYASATGLRIDWLLTRLREIDDRLKRKEAAQQAAIDIAQRRDDNHQERADAEALVAELENALNEARLRRAAALATERAAALPLVAEVKNTLNEARLRRAAALAAEDGIVAETNANHQELADAENIHPPGRTLLYELL